MSDRRRSVVLASAVVAIMLAVAACTSSTSEAGAPAADAVTTSAQVTADPLPNPVRRSPGVVQNVAFYYTLTESLYPTLRETVGNPSVIVANRTAPEDAVDKVEAIHGVGA